MNDDPKMVEIHASSTMDDCTMDDCSMDWWSDADRMEEQANDVDFMYQRIHEKQTQLVQQRIRLILKRDQVSPVRVALACLLHQGLYKIMGSTREPTSEKETSSKSREEKIHLPQTGPPPPLPWVQFLLIVLREMEHLHILVPYQPSHREDSIQDHKVMNPVLHTHIEYIFFHPRFTQSVPANTAQKFCERFDIPLALQVQLVSRLLNHCPKEGVRLLQQNATLHDSVDLKESLSILVRKQKFLEADHLVGKDQALQRIYLSVLQNDRSLDKIMTKRLKTFELDPNDFPQYVRRKQEGTLRYLVNHEKYAEIVELVENHKEMQVFSCHALVKKIGVEHAMTKYFVKRFHLSARFKEVDIRGVGMDLPDEPESKDNPPIQEMYLGLSDLVANDCVLFVDDVEKLNACVHDLRDQKVIGLDCEWKPLHSIFHNMDVETSLDKKKALQACALLQLATDARVYLVDTMLLKGVVLNKLQDIFHSKEIVKLGFDVASDFKSIRAAGVDSNSNHPLTFSVAQNVLDLKTVMKSMRSEKKLQVFNPMTKELPTQLPKNEGLSDLAFYFFGKPLDKSVRCSDWERRPLTLHQRHYAALDALILLRIYRVLIESLGDENVLQFTKQVRY